MGLDFFVKNNEIQDHSSRLHVKCHSESFRSLITKVPGIPFTYYQQELAKTK